MSAAHILLPTAYLPPIAYCAALAVARRADIEQYDSYHKQTYRNRCVIGAESGRLALNVPVRRTGRKQLVRDVRISYESDWQHLHWQALKSAYGLTPFFDYYVDDFRPYYERQTEFLIDFNTGLLHTLCGLIGIDAELSLTDDYRHQTPFADLRETFQAKHGEHPDMNPYWQVFSARHGFMENLSVIDLLFSLGPESLIYLTEAGKKMMG